MLGLSVTSCSPDEFDMPENNVAAGDLVEGIAYTVTHDSNNPNIVYLDSKMPQGYTVYWEHPQGRCQDNHVELRLPFEGEYTVKFGVETRGGLVFGEPTTFTINDFCAEFVTDELWTYLTGGVGKSKVWVYDNGKYGFLAGEISYGSPNDNPNFGWKAFTANWDPGMGHCEDADMWNSTMTFDLIGGANYSFYNSSNNSTQTGLFSINTDDHTMAFTDADLMHPDKWTARKADWRKDLKIIELDENHLRIGYVRQPGNWGGEWLEVFNYVSKEYAESYVPPVITQEPKPSLADGWLTLFNNQCIYASWTLDSSVPYDWFNLDGTRKNNYAKLEDYPQAYTPIALESPVTIKLTSPAANDYKVTLPDGSSIAGKFTVNEDGVLSLSNGVGHALIANGNIVFEANYDTDLQVLKFETDDLGRMSDIWLGYKERDLTGKSIQYVGYHFVADYGGAKEETTYKTTLNFNNTGNWTMVTGDAVYVKEGTYTLSVNTTWTTGDPLLWLDCEKFLRDHPNGDIIITDIKVDGSSISFDDNVISRGYPDDNAETQSARRYICNAWSLASCFPSLDIFKPSNGIDVTIKVVYDNGKPFIKE